MTQPWSVPPDLFRDADVAILASGPSMSQDVANAAARRYHCVTVNNTASLCPFAPMLVARDLIWWQHGRRNVRAYPLYQVGCCPDPHLRILTLRDTGECGFDERPDCVRTGGNSGHTALHVVAHGHPKRVLLLGFDMDGDHWHPAHPHPLGNPDAYAFSVWRTRLEHLACELGKRGIDVVCGTPSKLKLPYEPITETP